MIKKGFVFVETIIVLTVTMVALITLYNGSVLLIKNLEQKKYMDNINDVYKVEVIKRMLKSNLEIKDNNLDYIEFDSGNCTIYLENECMTALEDMGIEKVYFTKVGFRISADATLDNSSKRYFNTLNRSSRYIIIKRKVDGKNYHASLVY